MKNILGKLHAIMSEVNYIQKDKRNSFHGYNYASEAAIKEKLHELLVKHKVLFSTSIDGFSNERVTTKKGDQELLTQVRIKYAFFCVDSGENVSGEFVGFGQDAGDKGVYKAITGAIKYILTSTFLIPTGDDPEEDNDAAKGSKSTQEPVYVPEKPQHANKMPLTKASPKTDDKIKEEIATYLIKLGFKPESPDEYKTLAKSLTSLELVPENFSAIADRLSIRVKEMDTLLNQK